MTIIYFILAALALGILVFIHELGHLIAARLTGMNVEVFSIGFGKPLLKWRWKGIDWQLGWLPFGGYVRITGMELSKKEKNVYIEPYEIPNGFFSKHPFKRIIVALAGPLTNFIFAFLLFAALWFMGGREKRFSEFTQVVGWVDPKSELYALGTRPGDVLARYDGKVNEGSKSLLYAAMLGDRKVALKGYHVNYQTDQKTPFSYTIETYESLNGLAGLLTTGISSSASYLIYDDLLSGEPNPLPEKSSLLTSGIKKGDQFVWMDGELLFSLDQMSHLLNDGKALLTIQRGENYFLSRQPRIFAGDLLLMPHVRNEFIDWQYEANLKGRWQDLRVLPYNLSLDGFVEGRLDFIDEDVKKAAFPTLPFSKQLERALEPGDRIIAVDGEPVSNVFELLQLLQAKRVSIIVKETQHVQSNVSWKNGDAQFRQSFQMQELAPIINNIGSTEPVARSKGYRLLKAVQPKKMRDFYSGPEREKYEEEYQAAKEKVLKIKDPKKRAQALQVFEQTNNGYLLGWFAQDRTVNYNPTPLDLFINVFNETGMTLKALIFGYLHPKWLSGPVGIVQVIQHGWRVGIGEALFWIGAISVNLAILNLLPIPVLDGGYICLSLWEWITKRRLKAKTLERLIIPFVVLMIGLLIFLTFQDVSRLF